jgi:hypothetical protein
MTTTTEELTPEQRLETRRAILQSIGEMGRGLKVISGLLKLGRFGMARDQIIGMEAMLGLHEALATGLLKENTRLQKQLLDADAALTEAAVGYEGTAERMQKEALLPKAQRSPDFDHEDVIRYGHFATMARSSLDRFKKAAGLRG